MLGVRSLLRSNNQLIKNVVQQRNLGQGVIATPAREKVSRTEMLFLSGLMLVGWTIIPAWVLVNMKHYRDRD